MTPTESIEFARANLRHVLEGKNILLGISGSIAAFKACDLVRGLRDCGASVRAVLTDSAQSFVTPTTLTTLTGQPALCSLFGEGTSHGTHHIESARWADLALIAPATANTIAKLALGLADDLLSTELLAFQGPRLIAPAMNPAMYAHSAVQENLARLKSHGWRILGPAEGATACGEEGLGRMLEPDAILEEAARAFYAPQCQRHVVITMGPTISEIDPVRYLTNRSSGLMGAALCWTATQRGYRVTAIRGPLPAPVPLPQGIAVRDVRNAREMADAALSAWRDAEIFIAAAAVLDWDVANPSHEKLKKGAGAAAPALTLEANPDILALIAGDAGPAGRFVLGFAAETSGLVEHAREKLESKGCDAIFANLVSASPDAKSGFGSHRNSGWWIPASGAPVEIPSAHKAIVARKLFSLIESSRKVSHA